MKQKMIIKNGETYYNIAGLASVLDVTRQTVYRFVEQGLVVKAGRWYKVAPGYKMQSVWIGKIVPNYHWRSIEEMMQIEGISENEVMGRAAVGVYKYKEGKYRFLDEQEWDEVCRKNMDTILKQGWGNVKKGRKFAIIL